MKTIIAAATLSLACAPTAIAQMSMIAEPSPAVKACITTHASDVEQAIESLDEATSFLLQKICASELADQFQTWSVEQKRKDVAEQRARMKEICESRAARPTNSDSGTPQAHYADMFCDGSDGELFSLMGGTSVLWSVDYVSAPRATAFAAQTLLQIRSERQRSRQ